MQTGIHPDSHIGVVALNVRHLQICSDFYIENIGLQLISSTKGQHRLGVADKEILVLNEKLDALNYTGHPGLYHLAILLPSRLDLARSLRHLANTQTALQGFADHWVSEAIYLADPEGNGIEIYRDRARDKWPMVDGRLQMSTEPLDLDGLIALEVSSSTPWSGLPAATKIGHIHLQVSNIALADDFYTRLLGFDLIMHFGPSAGFVSAGGYHHHIGYNTWSAHDARRTPADAAGLAWFSIDIPSERALADLRGRLRLADQSLEEVADGLFLRDPFGNGILLRVE